MVEVIRTVVFGMWWARALARALRALGRPHSEPLAATHGLFRPEIRIGRAIFGA